ncbi:GNAT family N-acetyltransferase [Streptomyces sp. NPDC001843]|uniref:GNAT family N-acetyltransferase n=1 Tax=Streptomyces sp. NPDC001843 TaxID=3364617 RepID=UPI003694FEA8
MNIGSAYSLQYSASIVLRMERYWSFPDQHSTTEMVFLDSQHTVVGRLRFRMCGACHTGLILDVWISDDWQRQGLGRELVQTLVAHHSGVRWSTTRQTPQGRPFFSAMAEETSVPFPQRGALCVHLAGRLTRAWRRLTSRRSLPSAGTATH